MSAAPERVLRSARHLALLHEVAEAPAEGMPWRVVVGATLVISLGAVTLVALAIVALLT